MSVQHLGFLPVVLSNILGSLSSGRTSALGIIDYQHCCQPFPHFKDINYWFRTHWKNSIHIQLSHQLSHNPRNITQSWASENILTNITGINIEKLSRGGIYKPKLQAEILQNPEEVKSINQYYRQKYCKILKRWDLLTKITGINIEISGRGEIYKPTLQAEILQNPEEAKSINQHYRQKYWEIIKR